MKDKKVCKIMNVMLIICFALVIGVPLLSINRVEGKVSAVENKVLAAKPDLFLPDGTVNSNFPAEFKQYFDDNIGLRDSAMVVNLISKYKLFHVLDLDNWHLGDEGEQFYTTGGEEIKTYTGENKFTQEEMQEMTENLVCMNQYFKELGCDTYNMFIPNKEAVYSEWYSSYIHHEEKSRQDKFCEYLTEYSDLNVLNVKEALIEAAKEQRVYYKSYDASHWNMNGAFVGYRELMQEVEKEHSDIKVLSLEDFDISEQQWKGLSWSYDSMSVIKNCFDFKDIIYNYSLKNGWHYIVEENPPEGIAIDANLNYYHYFNESVDNQHSMLIVGDSYIYSFMMPFLAESVRDVYFIRNTDATRIMELAEAVNPDIFVFEVVERVARKEYYDYMSEYHIYKQNNMDLKNAVFNGMAAQIYIDAPEMENGVLTIDKDNMEILGWGFDAQYDMQPKAIIYEINGNYKEVVFYYRKDLADWDEKYANCGFRIKLNKEVIGEAKKITLYMVAQDGTVYNEYEMTIQ